MSDSARSLPLADGSIRFQTARKDHRCDACLRKIPKGARYWRKYIEDVVDRKEHTNCAESWPEWSEV